MRGRGLKQTRGKSAEPKFHVALHAGAWIETNKLDHARALAGVALHAGAWIETKKAISRPVKTPSRPPCGGVD